MRYLLKSSKSCLKCTNKLSKQLSSDIGVTQRRIQDPVEHLTWSFLRK